MLQIETTAFKYDTRTILQSVKKKNCYLRIIQIRNTVLLLGGKEINQFLLLHFVHFQVKDACVPFLRCCALFYHFLVGVPAPYVLLEVGGDTFENLCAYLGLPNSCHDLISSSVVFDLSLNWVQHEKVRIACCAVGTVSSWTVRH